MGSMIESIGEGLLDGKNSVKPMTLDKMKNIEGNRYVSMTKKEMRKAIKDKVMKYMALFYEHFEGKTIYPIGIPDIEFEPLVGETAHCWYQFHELTYCEGVLRFDKPSIKKNFKMYMDYIVGHEVAHWCVALMFGWDKNDDNKNHEGAFQQMMEFFELPPTEFCASFHYSPIKDMFQWKCDCSTLNFTKEEHKEALEWGCECTHCKKDLYYTRKG